jgi:hypothetical protein
MYRAPSDRVTAVSEPMSRRKTPSPHLLFVRRFLESESVCQRLVSVVVVVPQQSHPQRRATDEDDWLFSFSGGVPWNSQGFALDLGGQTGGDESAF